MSIMPPDPDSKPDTPAWGDHRCISTPTGGWACTCGWTPQPNARRQSASVHRHMTNVRRATR